MASEKNWIWLGNPDWIVNGTGALGTLPPDSYAFPFLEWEVEGTTNHFGLRFLVRKNAVAALAWLGVLGTTPAKQLTNNIDWVVVTLPNGWKWDGTLTPTAAVVTPESFNLVTGITFATDAPEIRLGILKIQSSQPVIDETSKSVALKFDISPASHSNAFKDVTGGQLSVEMKFFQDGTFSIQGTTIPNTELNLDNDIELGSGNASVILRKVEGRIGAQFTVPGGGKISPPLLPIGKTEFTWTQLSVLVSVAQEGGDLAVDILVPDGEVCTIDFALPLIEAQAPAERSGSESRLLVTTPDTAAAPATQNESLVTFGFSVTVTAEPAEKGLPVLRLRVDQNQRLETTIGETLKTLEELQAKFLDYTDRAKRTLSSMLGKFEGLSSKQAAVTFRISNLFEGATDEIGNKINELKTKFCQIKTSLSNYPVMFRLEVVMDGAVKWTFIALARVNVWKGQLTDNRIFVSAIPAGNAGSRTIDLDVAALVLPPAIDLNQFKDALEEALTNESDFDTLDRDGYLDVSRRELNLDFQREDANTQRHMKLVFPGGLVPGDDKYNDRVVLTTHAFDPDQWPQKPKPESGRKVHLRLSDQGLSMMAQVDTAHTTEVLSGPTKLRLTLEKERGENRSEFVIIKNQIRLGTMVGKLEAPGFSKRQVDMVLGLRQQSGESVPDIFAEMDVYRPDKSLVKMSVEELGLQGRIDSIEVKLGWSGSTKKWSVDASASGSLSYTGLASTGGMSGLDKEDTLPFENLNLMKIHKLESFKLPLRRAHRSSTVSKPNGGDVAKWQFLDGLVTIECTDVTLAVEFDENKKLKSAQLIVGKPGLKVATSGGTEVSLGTDELRLTWDGGKKLQLSFSGLIRFELKLGPTLTFSGTGGCKQTDTEKFFAASGRLVTSAFPEIETTLKFGSGRKKNGRVVPSIVVYAGMELEADLFPGVVLKRIGAGVSLNNRLAGVDRDPEPREILARLDQIRPENVDNWQFEPEGDIYVSFIASAWIASNRGAPKVVSAYVMALTMYIDTNLDVVAAGEVWLFSSLAKVRESANRSRPAMAGVIVFRPRKKTLSFVAETRPNPFIEANEQLSKILSKVKARFSFYISEDLVDYYLEELSYQETFLGASVVATGGYRIAIGRFGVLLRAWLTLLGNLPERKLEVPGCGGFEFSGNLRVALDFGGLIGSDGVSAYGSVDASIQFRVSAYVIVPTPAIEWVHVAKTISFTISYPTVKCRRWGCRTRWEAETIEETIIVDVPVPVIRQVPYRLPEQGIKLQLAGDVGFDSGGQIGFRGSLSISVPIFGYQLSISPSFDVQGQIIDRVKRRVAAVENSVNKLRNLPRPDDIAASTDEPDDAKSLTWTLYEKGPNANRWCLLVPSPESGDNSWFTPLLSAGDYVNMPRDTGPNVPESDRASAVERKHITPFRNSVVRILVPIRNTTDTTSPPRLLDLIMPWDRANMDSLPEPSEDPANDHGSAAMIRLQALKKIAQAEAELLSTAFKVDAPPADKELERWRIAGDKLKIVRDPRVGSSDRRFWSLADQLERPDWAPPSEYRSTAELVALGIAPRSAKSTNDVDLGAVLEYERLRAQSLSHLRLDASATSEVTRVMRARSIFLASLLNDFEQFPNPDPASHYATNAFNGNGDDDKAMLVERNAEGKRVDASSTEAQAQKNRLVTRRGLPLVCVNPEAGPFQVELDWLTIQNATDLLPDQIPDTAKVNVTWDRDSGTPIGELTIKNTPDKPLKHAFTLESGKTFDRKIVKLELDLTTVPKDYSGKTEDYLFIELYANYTTIERQIGLTFNLNADEQVDVTNIQIVRNVKGDADEPAKWFDDQHPQIRRGMRKGAIENDSDHATKLHDAVTLLTPCQTFIPDAVAATDPSAATVTPTSGRVQVQLAVRFQDEFFTSYFGSINRFEILRQFKWEREPVSLGEVPIRTTTWSVGEDLYVHAEPFLAADEFPVRVGPEGEWTFADPRLRPGVPLVTYFLRAVPFGETARTIASLPPVKWRPVTSLYLPPRREPLPPLALVFQADSLLQIAGSETSTEPQFEPQFVVFESTGSRFVKRWTDDKSRQPLTLELWVQPESIPLSGFYAPGDELTPDITRVTKAVRAPSELAPGPLPEDTAGKLFVGTLEFSGAQSKKDVLESAQLTLDFAKLRAGKRYRWYVRPKFESGDRRVVPLNLFLARQIPNTISTGEKLLAIDGLEFISQAEISRIKEPLSKNVENNNVENNNNRWLTADELRFEQLAQCPCRSDLLASDRNQLPRPVRLHWHTPRDAQDGGVEFIFQDAFTSQRIERTLVEVHSELIFARSQTDFRQATQWRLHSEHASGRLWEPQPANQKVPNIIEVWEYFLWLSDLNPLLDDLKKARLQVAETLNELFRGSAIRADWRTLHQALTNWFWTIDAYFQSPVVLESAVEGVANRTEEEQRVELLFARMRNLFLGLPAADKNVPDTMNDVDRLAKYNGQIKDIADAVRALESADPRQKTLRETGGDEAEAFKQAMLDFDMAQHLANIIRSRLNIVDTMRHASPGGTLDLAEANMYMVPGETWPHQAQWNTLVSQWFENNKNPPDDRKPRPLTDALLKPFNIDIPITSAPSDNSLHERMRETAKTDAGSKGFITNLERLADRTDPKRTKIGDALAPQVNEAAGLTAALVGIRSLAELRKWRLIRRPHHQVFPESEGIDASTAEKLSAYFAPAEFATNVTPTDTVVHYFNWLERMGFAIDLALVDEDNRYFSQRELVQQLEALDWTQILNSSKADHKVYILVAREPDTELPRPDKDQNVLIDDDDALGYAFVKLAVVPQQLLVDLSVVARTAEVKEEPVIVPGNSVSDNLEITLKEKLKATDFRATVTDLTELRLTLLELDGVDTPMVAKLVTVPAGDFDTLRVPEASGLKKGDLVRIEDVVLNSAKGDPKKLSKLSNELGKWTKLRGDMLLDNEPAYLVCEAALATEKLALQTSNNPNNPNAPKLIVVEPWGRRWQTVPSVGGWSHVLMAMPDRLGQKLIVGARRVSRYESFLRWLDKSAIPTVDRLHGLEEQSHVIVRRRRLLAGEEPRSLPVAVHPHPSRVEFLYRLPPSGSQSLLSAEAKRRTGFLECQLEFSRLLPTDFPEQIFKNKAFPDSKEITIAAKADVNAKEVVIQMVGAENPADYNKGVLVFSGQAIVVDTGSADGADKIKLQFSRPLNAELPENTLGYAIRETSKTSPPQMRPPFNFEILGEKLFLTDGDASPDSLVGYPVLLKNTSDPDVAEIVKSYNPDTREVKFGSPLGSFGDKGVLTVLSQETAAQFKPVPANGLSDEITLFRHERLVSLPSLPYYYKYQARIEPRYAADVLTAEATPITDSKSASGLPSASRSPGWTAVRPPRVKNIAQDQFEVTLLLNRLGDLLNADELREAVRLDESVELKLDGTPLGKVHTRDALDLETEYQLWLALAPDGTNPPPARIMTQVATIKLKKKDDVTAFVHAELKLLHGITRGNGTPDKLPVQCSYTETGVVPGYWLTFNLNVLPAADQIRDKLRNKENYRLIAVRAGQESRVVKCFS